MQWETVHSLPESTILGLIKEYIETNDSETLEKLLEKLRLTIEAKARQLHFDNSSVNPEEVIGESKLLIWEILEKIRAGEITLDRFENDRAFTEYLKICIRNSTISKYRKTKKLKPQELDEGALAVRSSVTRFGQIDEETETRKRALEILCDQTLNGNLVLELILSNPVSPKAPEYTELDLLGELNLFKAVFRVANNNNAPSSVNGDKGPTQREISQRLGVHEGTVSRSVTLALKRIRIALGIICNKGELNQADIRFIKGFQKSDIT